MSIDILGTLRELYLTSGIAMYASDPKALIMVAVAVLAAVPGHCKEV